MPFLTTVLESDPGSRSGFLEDPGGGKRIYFDFTGWRKKVCGNLVEAHTERKNFPSQGSKIEVVEKEDTETGYPRAKLWKLVERGKRAS